MGADGVHSAFATKLYPDEGAPLWNGITMWRALAKARPFLSGTTMVIVGHFGRRVVVYPVTVAGDDGNALLINVVLEGTTDEAKPMPTPRLELCSRQQ